MKEQTIKFLLTVAGSLFMLTFCLAPFVYMVVVSCSSNPHFLSAASSFSFTLKNYHAILTTPSLHFLDYLQNSLIVSALSAVFSILIAGLAAYAFTRLKVPGKLLILLLVLAVSLFPQISLISCLFKLMAELGWVNTYAALILPYIAWTLPLCVWILVSYFAQIPQDLDNAGLIDGCSRWQVMYKIVFPVAAPGIFSTALLAFIFAFNEFMFALMLTTDYQARTIPVGIALFQGLHGQTPWGNIMAASSLSALPLVLLSLVFQRHIIQGLTRGALKG
ncbi:carbohydrate ABC transporter permease [Desulfoferrobacter suflitae]|uniref:carbohydrate ABC transporter permease n=1 Tax=Desulfoferrobacter suflitae TaxID=2865782 RepID=UPI002164735E|nr:carbohydrate ABC transporter permease [Desulfoferrobacter suflitae]MCK8603053.1 carbohydrate ABC transporter permease [Desulfoferrobacter suflitae]